MASLNDLTLRQLEYVVAVADVLGFRKAAERCHVSQPALSAQIQQLEDVLGVKIFERDKRRVLLTQAGEELVSRARRVLTEAGDILSAASRLSDPFAGPLQLGVIPTVAPYVLPEVIPAVTKQYPQMRLRLREEKTELLVRGLEEGRLDAALVALDPELGDVEQTVIAEDAFVVALPPGHPLAKKKQVQLRDLDAENVLLLEDGHCFRSQALALCTRVGAREVDFRATSLTTLAQMVMSGEGSITLLPAISVPLENRFGQLEVRPLAPSPSRILALVWRPGFPRAGALRALADTMRAAWPGNRGAVKRS
ncbi:Hydrogen peroxide-inducible protein activator [Cystobacter fuscus DSM 2262]|uniref:Hydrogen peroxide-inducible protein activator n=1 Tax=Cystobacter fuscus (strain ATCC 25194 / DSM 2262 / NBRC 100088 / M29) TaxID=1242864 RepID=S9R2M2_CYSF2|nr:LysR substrate-binding domain-containing protein [Cystobacter fuscus]EPX63148.1 Hydrogen peroxide-inducible protein activator [Cystobacter fuscus DSM 2262]